MVDFYSALARKIQQVQDDPARMREVVYEAARLALRWQVAERGSLSHLGESKRLKVDLEEAIARLEAEAAGGAAGVTEAAGEADAVASVAEDAAVEPEKPAVAQLAAEPGNATRGGSVVHRRGAREITRRDRKPRACRGGSTGAS